jgi:L-threonylcarbamoyladenylate synthase
VETLLLKPSEDNTAIRKAAELLRQGGIVAIPTETVYGLAANALDEGAVNRIFKAKGRPQDNPLIVHICEFDEIYPLVRKVPPAAKALAETFWPGPLTLVLPRSDKIPNNVSAGLDTVAVRMPSHPVAWAIIKESGLPLAAPSANISGFPSPTAAQHVQDDMTGRIDAIVDGGECEVGVESTVLSLTGEVPVLLRPGGVTLAQLESVLGRVEVNEAVLNPLKEGETAASPGMRHKHYAPKAEITVIKGSASQIAEYVAAHTGNDLAVLCFEGDEHLFTLPTVTFGRENDAFSQARGLFGALRRLDELGAKQVFACCPSQEGVGLAVCNRLFRAAEFRIIEIR